MISQLHELRDLLENVERWETLEDWDQGAIDRAFDIVDALILRNERPLPIPAVNSVYSVPTPFSPASAPPPPPKPKAKRPENQRPSLNSRKKRKVAA